MIKDRAIFCWCNRELDMFDWIIEADIYRFEKALSETGRGPERDKLLNLLQQARAKLPAKPNSFLARR